MEDEKRVYKIAVTWGMAGYIEVEAETIKEAMERVKDSPDDWDLPYDGGYYVDGSFRPTTNNVEEMKELCK